MSHHEIAHGCRSEQGAYPHFPEKRFLVIHLLMLEEQPFLSIVVIGRNDNHNGDFDLRAEYAMRHNVALLAQYGLKYEFIWVEWNPLSDRPWFALKVRSWIPGMTGYVVPAEIHTHFCDNPGIGVMQFLAKNVGIRRASGKWVLSMNADTYLTSEVLVRVVLSKLKDKTMYLATRVDFPADCLRSVPVSYPLGDLTKREVVRVSEIRLPKGFGSAGDFTLMSGSRWRSLGGHYEGIRFSNNHVDSLLGLQHADMGGDFEVLGNIYHSDHADSWNNFAAGDGLKHHHGNNYDWNLVRLPYRNPGNWGMADFIEERNDDGFVVLKPPVGLDLRRKAPDRIVIPPEFSEIENMTRLLVESLREIKKRKLKVVIYGLGDQIKKLIMNQQSGTIRIVGYIDENRLHDDFPHRRVTWQEMGSIDYDVVLIGSLFWARPLHAKALQYVPECRIMPRSLTLQSGKGKNINTKGFTETAARDSPGL